MDLEVSQDTDSERIEDLSKTEGQMGQHTLTRVGPNEHGQQSDGAVNPSLRRDELPSSELRDVGQQESSIEINLMDVMCRAIRQEDRDIERRKVSEKGRKTMMLNTREEMEELEHSKTGEARPSSHNISGRKETLKAYSTSTTIRWKTSKNYA